jgi:hypothetical protein
VLFQTLLVSAHCARAKWPPQEDVRRHPQAIEVTTS